MKLSIVCWRWSPREGYLATFSSAAINALAGMVRKHYERPHRFICVTDDPHGIDPSIEVLPLWSDFANLRSPHGRDYPACYRRLRMFHPEAGKYFGERFVSLDLDSVILRDMRPLWDRTEEFVAYRDPTWRSQYNGSMMLLTAGARPSAWEDFDPACSPRAALAAGYMGSDQGWISYILPDEATWEREDGAYSYRVDVVQRKLPVDAARIVFFHGNPKPWDSEALKLGWVRDAFVQTRSAEPAPFQAAS